MSKNLSQVYIANPVTTIGDTDLFYTAATGTTDAGLTGATLKAAVSPLSAKGDLYTYSTVNVRLPVATGDGKILQVSSGAATGLAWSASTISLGGNFTTAGAFTQAGAFATTITSTATSNSTLPAGTKTLAATDGTGASGTWNISILGNAATATTATTATNATNVATTQTSTNASYFPLFVSSSTNGNQAADLGTGLTFNPSTNNLATTTFTGALVGNASTATTATNATNVATTQVSTNASFFPLFVSSSTNGNQAADLGTGLTFNPSTNALSTTTFAGALSGNATTATNVASIAATSLYGNSTGSPAAGQAITLGTNLSFSGTTLNATAGIGSLVWNDVSGTSQAAAVNNGYIISNSSLTTVTIPATAAEGSVFGVQGKGAAGWKLQMNTGQTCHLGSSATTSAGSLASTNLWDSVQIVCVTADTVFAVISVIGSLTVA